MIANGLAGRCFRCRRVATTVSLPASAISWKPPRPSNATIRPSRIAATVRSKALSRSASTVPSASRSVSLGPHAGQQFVSAWKRRLAGSSYSAWQAGHIGKCRIAVRARS
jgi:hypothetical protein